VPVTASPTTKITRKHVVLLLCNGACSINQIKKKYTHAHIRTHKTYIHTYIHTHTRTYIHTYIHTYIYNFVGP